MSVVELSLHDGRKTGIPGDSALLIMDLTKKPPEGMPKAKTMVRYQAANGAKHAFLCDGYKHVLSCFPMPFGGPGWAHLTELGGGDMVISKQSVIGFEEREEKDGFNVTFGIPTGPIEIPLKATIGEVRTLLAGGSEAPAEEQNPPEGGTNGK